MGLLTESSSLNNGSLLFFSTCYTGTHINTQHYGEGCFVLLSRNCWNRVLDMRLEPTSYDFKFRPHAMLLTFHLPSWLFLKYRNSLISLFWVSTFLRPDSNSSFTPNLPGLPFSETSHNIISTPHSNHFVHLSLNSFHHQPMTSSLASLQFFTSRPVLTSGARPLMFPLPGMPFYMMTAWLVFFKYFPGHST